MGNINSGFASLKLSNPKKFREICSMGGKKAHKVGTAHEWTSSEARVAGIKGGKATAKRRREKAGN